MGLGPVLFSFLVLPLSFYSLRSLKAQVTHGHETDTSASRPTGESLETSAFQPRGLVFRRLMPMRNKFRIFLLQDSLSFRTYHLELQISSVRKNEFIRACTHKTSTDSILSWRPSKVQVTHGHKTDYDRLKTNRRKSWDSLETMLHIKSWDVSILAFPAKGHLRAKPCLVFWCLTPMRSTRHNIVTSRLS